MRKIPKITGSKSSFRSWSCAITCSALLLGICNLVFWQIFVHVNVVPLGIVATAYHFVFVIANGAAASLARRELAHA